MTDTVTTDSGPLTREQAVELLIEQPAAEVETPQAPVEAAAEVKENTEGETSAPEEAEDGAETPAEEIEAEAEPEAVAPAEPPKYWSQDAKAKFAELPPELQAVVLAQEGPREEAAAKAKADAAAKTQLAEAEMGKVAKLAHQLAEFLPEALDTFQSRWGQKPDWVAYAQEHGAEAMTLAKAQHDAEAEQLQQLVVAEREAGAQAHQQFLKVEFSKLAEIAPELAPDANDPKQGVEKRQAVISYLAGRGFEEGALSRISAEELSLAHDAMQWRQAQAKLKAAPKPPPAPAAKPSPVRPAAAPAQSSSQRTAQQLGNRFAQTRSVDDAVALLVAKGS